MQTFFVALSCDFLFVQKMRFKYILFLVLIVLSISLLIYIPIASKLFQSDLSSVSSKMLNKANASKEERIKIISLDPNIVSPVLSNPMTVQQGLKEQKVVKSSNVVIKDFKLMI